MVRFTPWLRFITFLDSCIIDANPSVGVIIMLKPKISAASLFFMFTSPLANNTVKKLCLNLSSNPILIHFLVIINYTAITVVL